MKERTKTRNAALRAALVVTLAAGASAIGGCARMEERFVEGTSSSGEPCAHARAGG